jgi:hypothetical protein
MGRVAATHSPELQNPLGAVSLPKSDSGGVLMHLDAEVEAKEAEVAHVEGLLHLSLKRIHFSLFHAGDDQAVDIDADEQDRASTATLVHCHLVSALLEAHLLECGVQLGVPGAQSLPQTIQSLAEAVDLPFFSSDGGGCYTYTSSLRSPLRKANLTSMWWMHQPS